MTTRPRFALLVVVAAVFAACGPGPTPSPVPSPTPGASPSASPFAYPIDVRFPTDIDGQPVLYGALIKAHAESATDDTPFLIGGRLQFPPEVECMATSFPPGDPGLVPTCSRPGPYLFSASADPATPEIVTVWLSPHHPSVSDIGLPQDLVVYRVHSHDPLAAACSGDTWALACRNAIVIEKLVWKNGAAGVPSAHG